MQEGIMQKIIVVSTTSDNDSYGHALEQHFIKGSKAAGTEVEIISLCGKTLEEAYGIGKRLFAPIHKDATAIPRPAIKVGIRVQKMVLALGEKTLPRRQILAELGLKQRSRPCFINNYLRPAEEQGYIEFAYPNSPHKPEQAYKLSAKGLELYHQLRK